MLNMHFFNVDQLNILTRYALHFTDFDTDSLSRDTGASEASQILSPEFIHNILLKISTLCIEYIEAGKIINEEVIKNHLNFNSHDWCKILKYTFQNTTFIDKSCMRTERNWLQFSGAIMSLCFTEANMNDSAEDSAHKDDLFSKYIRYPNISGEFKNFIGQLIKDGFVKEAKAIHNMLKYARKIITNQKNGVSAEKLSTLISVVFFMGLEILEGHQRNTTKQKLFSMPPQELYVNYLTIFTAGFSVVLEDPVFSSEFNADSLYLGCGQQYVQSASKKSLTDVMTEVVTENLAKLTLSNPDAKLSRKKSAESKKELKVAELKKSSETSPFSAYKNHMSTSPRTNNSSVTTEAESTSPRNSLKLTECEPQSHKLKESSDYEWGNRASKLKISDSPAKFHKNSAERQHKKNDADLLKKKHKVEMPYKEKEYDNGLENDLTPFLIMHTKKPARPNIVDAFSMIGPDNELSNRSINETDKKIKINEFRSTK